MDSRVTSPSSAGDDDELRGFDAVLAPVKIVKDDELMPTGGGATLCFLREHKEMNRKETESNKTIKFTRTSNSHEHHHQYPS